MVRRCWVNFQFRGVLLIWIVVGQGPTALAVGAGGGCVDIFSLIYHFSFLSPPLWETARYRLKYCLKGPLSPKQPTNQLAFKLISLQHRRRKRGARGGQAPPIIWEGGPTYPLAPPPISTRLFLLYVKREKSQMYRKIIINVTLIYLKVALNFL